MGAMFIVAGGNPRPPPLNDSPVIVIETERGKTHLWACLVQLSYCFLCEGDSSFWGLIYMYVRDLLGGVEFLGIYSGVERRLFTEFHNNLFC